MRKKPGFTFMELITLIAMVNILAAIIAPNFQEAQIRSKASRARGNMRCVASALEAYFIDHKAYIPDGLYGVPPGAGVMFINYMLTTPVAYISSLTDILEPFPNPKLIADFPITYRYMNVKFRYADILDMPDVYNNYNEIFGAWALYSNGPDMLMGPFAEITRVGALWACTTIYDPTNGVASSGDIIRCHKTGDIPRYW